ncbi:oxidoreductase with NAD+ or NADP+ as acceptor [Saitozyma sp. JCM 24511]|nr:oxidoreductase with NAD+ or NADP+ as acceptor [Saitozyma sp. JCM 24511]
MQYVNLGKSGLKVSRLILGCMTYGSAQGWMIPDEEECFKQLKYAYDRGINTFDTANVYSFGQSEIILGKFLKKYNIPRESVVIMTKTYHPDNRDNKADMKAPSGWTNLSADESQQRIFASVKNSLERLQLDYVDVIQCHRFDKDTPIEETMHALHDVVQSGLVRYIGMSSCWAWQFQILQQYALHNKLTPFISMQNQHNAMYREEEREMMPTLEYFGVGSIPWGPLAAGLLCRPYAEPVQSIRGVLREKSNQGAQETDKEIIDAVEVIAKRKGVTMAQIALAWSLHNKYVCAPIIGINSTERLDDLIKALDVQLSGEEIKSIEQGYLPQSIKGHT